MTTHTHTHTHNMSNRLSNVSALHDDDVDGAVAWIVVPVILGTLLYMTLALFVWPYARPNMSLTILLLCIFFPPFFPFLLFFLLFSVPYSTPAPVDVVIVETRGRPHAITHAPVMKGSRV